MNAQSNPTTSAVQEGELVWTPSQEWIESSVLHKYMQWLSAERGLHFADYASLWSWSTSDLDAFWRSIWDFFRVEADGEIDAVVEDEHDMLNARWFRGTYVNYAEHLMRHEKVAPDKPALIHSSEMREVREMSWRELGEKVRALAGALRRMGIKPGDRVVSYMPNIAETAIAMIASTAIGAIWSSAAPEFGAQTVINRFQQIAPKLIFAADGYSFNGTIFDRREDISKIIGELPTLEHMVWFPYLELGVAPQVPFDQVQLTELLAQSGEPIETFRYERVPHDHPLWILFSSGTTGLPKAIVHSHVGIVLAQSASSGLHINLSAGKRMFFYTTTGWVMWNALFAGMLLGSAAVLFDGSPVHGGMDCLWRMAEKCKATLFGASPTLVQIMKAASIVPKRDFDVSSIDTILLGGSPATPETFQWFYENVKQDLFVSSSSGGTEVAVGLVASAPIQPTYAGEIQARALGMAVDVWDDDGRPVVDTIGELVVTKPMPSAPLYFWNDVDKKQYFESYFSTYPGVWRHGDLTKLNTRGGVYIYGRSDSTLNRFGVRIGTAEIYNVLQEIPEIADSLIICCETANGGFYMPLFVSMRAGKELDAALIKRINSDLKNKASPRHMPDEIHLVPGIPYTLTGKKMEVPVRKLVMGIAPEKAASRDTMAAPAILDWYIAFANRTEIRARMNDTHSATG